MSTLPGIFSLFMLYCGRQRFQGEELTLSPEVRAAIEKLKDIDGEGTDLILLASDPKAQPRDRFDLIQDYIEPVFEEFFQEDVREYKEKKNKNKQEGRDEDAQEEESMEGGSRGD